MQSTAKKLPLRLSAFAVKKVVLLEVKRQGWK
jgi:hypothetical protein